MDVCKACPGDDANFTGQDSGAHAGAYSEWECEWKWETDDMSGSRRPDRAEASEVNRVK